MRTLCLLLTEQDKAWVPEFVNSLSSGDDVVFAAPTFEGAMVARALGLDFELCEEMAWEISKTEIHDAARRMAVEWFAVEGVCDKPEIRSIAEIDGYPLIMMHHTLITISMMEVLESWQLINRIISHFQPDRIVCGARTHPFAPDKDRLFAVTGSKGLDLEALKVAARMRGIALEEMRSPTQSRAGKSVGWIYGKARGAMRRLYEYARHLVLNSSDSSLIFVEESHSASKIKRLLANCYGGYYLDQVRDSLIHVAKSGVQVVVNVIGGQVTSEQKKFFREHGVLVFDKLEIPVPLSRKWNEKWGRWRIRRKADRAMRMLEENASLKRYFSDAYGCFFPLAIEAIRREVCHGISETWASLMRMEAILGTLKPDAVVSQFDFHPIEACDVLPARKLGLPTLGMDHGVCGSRNAFRHAYASQYFAASGRAYADALSTVYKSSGPLIFPVGELRMDEMRDSRRSKAKKLVFGLDPERPVCVFCDNSGWRMTNEWRNSELRHVNEILRLKQAMPELQLIYRVHHGSDFVALERYIDGFGLKDVHFQVSPTPLFSEVVLAADLVISHFSSSIAEALVCGVPVIYLCALSELEPACLGYDAIKVVRDFRELGTAVDFLVRASMSREEVRGLAQDYFDRNLCGNDGYSSVRLAEKMVALVNLPEDSSRPGFEDWKQRVWESGFTRMVDKLDDIGSATQSH